MDSVPSQQFFRPALVTWIGIILIIFDVIAIGLTLYIYFVSQKLITSLEKVKDILFKDKEPNFPAARIALINKTVLTIIFSLAFIVFAIFFLKGYQWARIVTIILAFIGIVDAVMGIIQSEKIAVSILKLLIRGSLFFIVLLSTDVKTYFELAKIHRLERKMILTSRST